LTFAELEVAQVKTQTILDGVVQSLKSLTTSTETLAASVIAHDTQIGVLLQLAEKHDQAIANLERQWQAYINTLPRQ